jgi:hypothetical protein
MPCGELRAILTDGLIALAESNIELALQVGRLLGKSRLRTEVSVGQEFVDSEADSG